MIVDFYFDFVSPYAYLAWRRAARLAPSMVLRPRAVLVGAVLAQHGQPEPADIPGLRSFVIRDSLRRAAEDGLTLVWPPWHPFKSARALKLVHAALPQQRAQVVEALFAAAWQRGEDLEQDEVLAVALAGVGLPAAGLLTRAASEEESLALRAEVSDALGRGVFDVPTWIDGEGELFFGDDQLARLVRKLAGDDPLDAGAREVVRQVESRPLGARRRRR